MSNKMNPNHSNNAVTRTDNHDVTQKTTRLSMDEKYREQFTGLAMETGRGIISSIKENAGDYKMISED